MGSGDSRRRWSRIFKSDPRTEINDELSFHLEERVRDYIAQGMDPDEARAAAERRLGELDGVRDECAELLTQEHRADRRRDWMKMSWLDFKLGFRMLSKHPGITLVGGIAMGFAIWVGAGTFEFVRQFVFPTLPLPDGDRIVAIRNWDVSASRSEDRAVYDLVRWRDQLKSVDELGGYRTVERNLAIEGHGIEPVRIADISASAFRVARVRPLMGRTLVDADEKAGAAAVLVIGYEIWQRRFAGDPAVIGQTVRVGDVPHTIVGVMPEAFGFPLSHRLWTPLRLDGVNAVPREGPSIRLFGKLAPGTSLDEVQAELTMLRTRTTAAFPNAYQHLRPQVMPYARSIMNPSAMDSLFMMSFNLFLVMLVILICANVALLMFARAAARESELVVRSALGASRGRIITQLFVEALVLGSVATIVGLAASGAGLRWALAMIEAEVMPDGFPFWLDGRLSPTTVLYAVALTFVGAVVAGVVPGLKVTRGLQTGLREAAAGGGGPKFGGLWTAVIVAQVAVTVAFPATAFILQRPATGARLDDATLPANEYLNEYLTARIELDRDSVAGASAVSDLAFDARLRYNWQELERRLAAEPAVSAVTFGDRLPRMYHPYRLIEVDAGGAAPMNPKWPGYRVSSASVDPGFFAAFHAPIIAGRGFLPADARSDQRVVIVNERFVERVLGGRNAIGRHVRFTHFEEWSSPRPTNDEPWYQIVGVVSNVGFAVPANTDPSSAQNEDPKLARIYHPAAPGNAYPIQAAIRLKGDPQAFAPRLREVASSIDPSLRLYDPVTLDRINDAEQEFVVFVTRTLILVSAVALLLSLAGIYATTAFTVARRTREIGIRSALGGNPRRIIASTFARPLTQVAVGILAGAILVGVFMAGMLEGMISARQALMLVAYAVVMLAVCMFACVVPARRALSIQPTQALRTDA